MSVNDGHPGIRLPVWTPYHVRDNRLIMTGDPMPETGVVLVGERLLKNSVTHQSYEVHPLDLFAPCDGPVLCPEGFTKLVCDCGRLIGDGFCKCGNERPGEATHADVLRDVFHQLDARPDVRLLCVCGEPERVKLLGWMPEDCNLTIHAGPIRTQADLERLAPAVLGLRDLCQVGLWFDGPGEAMDILDYVRQPWMPRPIEYLPVFGIDSILLTNCNQHSADVARHVDGAGRSIIFGSLAIVVLGRV